MTTSTKPKPVELSAGESAALFLANRIERGIIQWQDSRTFMTPEPVLEDTRHMIIALGDDCASWPRPKWKLLVACNQLCGAMQRDSTATAFWNPPRLENAVLAGILKVCELVKELQTPAPPAMPRQVPLESVDTLIKQGVSTRQCCKIHGWTLANGEPDVETFRKAERGEIEVPTHKVLPPVHDGPTKAPHPYMLLGLACELCDHLGESRDSIVEAVLEERDRNTRPAPGRRCRDAEPESLVQIDSLDNAESADDQVDLPIGEKMEQPKRRGRPRKSIALERVRTG